MNHFQWLKRPFVWLWRIKYRCGYGVHSPFAFEFITAVIYETTPYYAYAVLPNHRVGRLLFRIANWIQPGVIMDSGCAKGLQDFLRNAKPSATYLSLPHEQMSAPLPDGLTVDFLYIHTGGDANRAALAFEQNVGNLAQQSVCVIEDIHVNSRMKRLWQQILSHDKVIISFDLYDVGILFFDDKMIKQHYIVNF